MSERLEEIKREAITAYDKETGKERKVLFSKDYDYLIQRLKELEEAVNVYKEAKDWLDEVEQNVNLIEDVLKNERYKKALEFYADEMNYSYSYEHAPEVLMEDGNKARKALEESE